MSRRQLSVAQQSACILLGVSPDADEHDLRAAFREAAKIAHPDRPTGDAERFRAVLDAYHLLQNKASTPALYDPQPLEPQAETLNIHPEIALGGGAVLSPAWNGKRIRLTLPAGLRNDDLVRAGERIFRVFIVAADDMQVRGDDLWLTAAVDPKVLETGGRVSVETPLGRRIVWITDRAGQRGLVRLPGQGLPARSGHPRGDLFLRLEPAAQINESAARALLRRFAAAWAA
jgi:curved DNA-binding protein